jgi:hypothetical protein
MIYPSVADADETPVCDRIADQGDLPGAIKSAAVPFDCSELPHCATVIAYAQIEAAQSNCG